MEPFLEEPAGGETETAPRPIPVKAVVVAGALVVALILFFVLYKPETGPSDPAGQVAGESPGQMQRFVGESNLAEALAGTPEGGPHAAGQPPLAPNAPVGPRSQQPGAASPPPGGPAASSAGPAAVDEHGHDPSKAHAPVGRPGQRLNPAHGEPGHTCALPVGAPLPDDAAAPASALSGEQKVSLGGATKFNEEISVKPGAAGASLGGPRRKHAPGWVNPPHGAPGHDCAIPVGQGEAGAESVPPPPPKPKKSS